MHSPGISRRGELPRTAAQVLARLRAKAPRVHCVTNSVAQNFTANALLAAGCVPSMTISPEEIGDFAGGADALLVNLGTFDAERRQAIGIAVAAVQKRAPWVLDPVFVDRAATRCAFAQDLIAKAPRAIRLNRAEFKALSGGDATSDTVKTYAAAHRSVIGLSGETDLVTDGTRLASISNGHPLMAKVTAMGCAASALTAACLAVDDDAWCAVVSALLIFGVAGEIAAEHARGPGTFAAAFIDALAAVDGDALLERAKVN